MLNITREIGESVLVFDRRSELWITVTAIDPEAETATVTLGNDPDDPEHYADAVEISLFEPMTVLQGDGSIMLAKIREFDDGETDVVIGIKAPPSMHILRDELIAGTSREKRKKMLR